MVGVLGLHAVASGSNPSNVKTTGQDLFSVVRNSALPCLVNSQLVAFCLSDY